MSEIIKVVRSVRDLRKATSKWRQRGQSIALVPTMGALHAGHLALVKLARKKADKTVVSIFVNPTQFGPNEDLSRYPRDEAGDLEKLAAADADLVWAPGVEEMYPEGFSAGVRAGSAAKELEGEFRPFHFDGVATVCTKLFNQVTPDVAIFGEKDYQQLAVLRQVVRDLNMPLKIIGAPTKRDSDGLALSSRNAYLSEAEREIAPALNAVIAALAEDVANGADVVSGIANAKRKLAAAGFTKIDYVEVRDAETLAVPPDHDGRDLRVLAAAWLGKTRLIDNVAV
ncbi:pantoate--beta-alanine ligase [Hyphomicrobium sp.]|uniref:pantoate--beta-alanine ligase n=1 Tax=Hyphomicrobium sp. TaxID=82 RepID=UPI000F9D157D|nr:pantoate--beta-alanine ligase [Hyphomicrobium sp.]RUP09225.1 MAG: pantoate--beta-alanine ligase [Hyphomicrobium sp.]